MHSWYSLRTLSLSFLVQLSWRRHNGLHHSNQHRMADQENTTITQLRRSPRKTRRPNYTDPGSTRPVSGFGQKRSPKRKLQTTPPPAKRQCLRSNTNVSNQPSQPTSSEEDEQATCHELKAQICRLQALNKTLQRKVYAMEQELSPQRNSISKRKTSKDGHAHKAKRRNNQAINRRKKQDEEGDRLHQFEDFQNQKSMLEELIESMNHEMIMLPKFHCELNDMEIIWAISKGRHQRDNTFKTKTHEDRFRKALASISQTEVRHISVKIREYEQAYNQGATTTNVCEYIAKMKKARKTHKVICAPKQLVNNDLNNNI
eukprot:551387_1